MLGTQKYMWWQLQGATACILGLKARLGPGFTLVRVGTFGREYLLNWKTRLRSTASMPSSGNV